MSKIKKISLSILALIIFACEEKEKLQFIEPEIFVSTAYLKQNSSTIEVNCETINPSSLNKEEFGICWSEKPNPKITDNYQYSNNNSIEEGPFVGQIVNIKPNIKYYIRGYMRVAGKDIYSEDFVFEPITATGWFRLDDIPRDKNVINLPDALLINNIATLSLQRKLTGFEESIIFYYNVVGKYWLSTPTESYQTVYDRFFADIEYGPGSFDYISGGGYIIENPINKKKKFLKKASTFTYSSIENYPGADAPAVAFGAGNKAFVIEVKPNPSMFAFNEEDFTWEKMKALPFPIFTNLKATRVNRNGLVILENNLATDYKLKVFYYDFETDSWQPLPDFPGLDRTGGVLFSIKDKVYFGLGEQKTSERGLKDMWEYDIASKEWTQIANYPGAGSVNIAYVKKGNSVFIGMGYSSLSTDIGTSRKFMAYDFWEFRP